MGLKWLFKNMRYGFILYVVKKIKNKISRKYG